MKNIKIFIIYVEKMNFIPSLLKMCENIRLGLKCFFTLKTIIFFFDISKEIIFSQYKKSQCQ